MVFHVRCPKCSHVAAFPESLMGSIAQCPSCQQELRLAKPDATHKAGAPAPAVAPLEESAAEPPGLAAIPPRRPPWVAFLSGALGGITQRIVLLVALILLLAVTLYYPYRGGGGGLDRSFLFTAGYRIDFDRLMLEWASVGFAVVISLLLVNVLRTEGVRRRMARAATLKEYLAKRGEESWQAEQMKRLECEHRWEGGGLYCTIYNGSEARLDGLTVRVRYGRNHKTMLRDIDLDVIVCSRQVDSMVVNAGIENGDFVSLEVVRARFTRL